MAEGTPEAPTKPREKLREVVDAFSGQGFAVLDGGHFPDLPTELRRARLFARSLFLDSTDPEVQAAGPWLVALAQAPDATEKVFALVGDTPAAVFWDCEEGDMVLWRHLRGLNMARLPKWAAHGKEEPGPTDDTESYENVFFRHFDPRVLAQLLPCLGPAQFARILGPAEEIAFFTKDFGGVRRVIDVGFPDAPTGMLAVGSDQLQELTRRRLYSSHIRIMVFLRQQASVEIEKLEDAVLLSRISTYQEQANYFGVREERSIALWSYMQITSPRDLSADPLVLKMMKRRCPGDYADHRMRMLFDLRSNLAG